MHLSISANMWDWARLLDHAHLRTWYVIWEWPGVVFVLFLWIALWTSSLVRVSNGRLLSAHTVMFRLSCRSSSGGGWYSSFQSASHLSWSVVVFGRFGPCDIGGVG